jgi:hypothetical protein
LSAVDPNLSLGGLPGDPGTRHSATRGVNR